MARQRHPLIQTLLALKGNPRACVYTEPIWGIAYYLYLPFATLYMSQLGVSDGQIGLLLSISMLVQIVSCLVGGAVIDKIGRRRGTFILGLIAWSVPILILTFARGFWWFMVAAIFTGVNLIETVAWNCLFVEDTEPERLVDLFNWMTICGLLAVFFAPLAGLMVHSLTLVPAVRILYGFAFVMITAKIVLLYVFSHETERGRQRMAATHGVPIGRLLGEQRDVLRLIVGNRETLRLLAIMMLIHVTNLLTTNFFALFATRNAAIPDWMISWFPIARSAIMLAFIFGIQNRISRFPIRRAMLVGLTLYLAAIGFLLLAPVAGGALLIPYIVLDAFAYALVWPRRNSLVALYVDPEERARILGLLNVLMITLASPFGWIAGWLSDRNRALPFVLNGALYVICGLVLYRARPTADDLHVTALDAQAQAGQAQVDPLQPQAAGEPDA